MSQSKLLSLIPDASVIFDSEELYLTEEEEVLYSLLEEVLAEVFVFEEDSDSLEYLSGKSIYDLADEKEIVSREKYAQEALDEGCPNVEEFDELLALAEHYFQNPKQYPIDEGSEYNNHVTGFIQIYSGQKFDKYGAMTEHWKSVDCKIVVAVKDLLEPEKIIKLVECLGFKWTELIRVVFYGSPLLYLVDSRFYKVKESKELVPLEKEFPNILLAVPDYCEADEFDESIFEWIDKEIQEGIPYGIIPEVGRVTTGHWEMTWARLDELAEQELEQGNLLQFSRRERCSVSKKNYFNAKYQEARNLISGLNSESLSIGAIYGKDISVLEDVIHLSTRFNERINNVAAFLQIKSLVTKSKIQKHQTQDSFALSLIQRINKGDYIEIHLISLTELEKVFAILWGNLGIKIIPTKKEIYHQLKSRLFQLRTAKSSSSA